MKKLLFLLVVLLSGCKVTCILAQPPAQVIFAGSACTSPIPDYKPFATIVGGCTGFILTQTPEAGTLLTVNNKTANVIMKAIGSNGKFSQVQFTVTMADTITPKFGKFTGPLAELDNDSLKNKANELYQIADNMAITAGMGSYDLTKWPGLTEFLDQATKAAEPFERMTIIRMK